jgi:SPP1 gp7 family putative phage head morphogenesis protein
MIRAKLAKTRPERIRYMFAMEAAKVAYWEGYVRDTESFEPNAIHELRNMFDAQLKEALDNLRKAKNAEAKLIDREKAIQAYLAAISGIQKLAMDKAMSKAEQMVKPINPHAVKQIGASAAALAWLQKRMEWAAQEVYDETELMLRTQLSEGFSLGEGIAAMAGRIQDTFDECNQVRAERIARTEIIAASSQGAVETYKELGITHSEWYPALDERECELCETLAGDHPLEEKYTPPAHPNCRCVLLPVID